MQAPMPESNNLLDALARIGVDPSKRVYALMDGARFDDLPGMLAASGLSHRSLYRNVQDAELVRAGPWLVDPYRAFDPALNAWGGLPLENGREDAVAADTDAALRDTAPGNDLYASASAGDLATDPLKQLELIAGIAGDTPAAVFWIGDADLTEANLWRHLRTLNMVLIPREFLPKSQATPAEQDMPEEPSTHEAVHFRHADGNVLGEVLPALDLIQFSRFFGPAAFILFASPNHPDLHGSTIKRAILPKNAPRAEVGLLKFNLSQLSELEAGRLEASTREVMQYVSIATRSVRHAYPERKLNALVAEAMEKSEDVGADTRIAQCRWALIYVITEGKIYDSPRFHSYVQHRNSGLTGEEKFKQLVERLVSEEET
jgi:hypothetical protein